MTPDELPADMEASVARLERAVKDAVLDLARANLARADLTPDKLPADMERRLRMRLEDLAALGSIKITTAPNEHVIISDVVQGARALLKAYQDRGRALVACRGAAAPLLEQSEDRVWRRAKLIVDTVDAALNQRGDER
jgi:hypothetical protein